MKRTRLVDILLMVGLFLVGAAILWTLFTLGNDRARPADADDAPPAAEAPADPDAVGDVEVVPPPESGGAEPAAADAGTEEDADEDAGADGAEGAADANEGGDADGEAVGADGEPADEGAQAGDSEGAEDAEGADAPDPSPPPAPAEPIVEGEPVALQRVGFSFATGGAGACGIELEPWEHVAVSRDVLAVYGCGTEIVVELGDEIAGRTQATLVVADTMNEQFARTANIYVDPEEPALEYGITDGTLIP